MMIILVEGEESRLVEGDNYSDNYTGEKIIHFCLLCEKLRDSYFGVFWDGILTFGPTQNDVASRASDRS